MKKLKPLALFALCLLVLTSCRPAFLAADQLPWMGEEPVLFRDDYSEDMGIWTTWETQSSFSAYDQGGLRLWAGVPEYQFWSVPGLNFEDVLVNVHARKLTGPDNNLFGLICRYQDADNFYALTLGSDGYYGIYKRVDGEQSLIDQTHMDFSEAIARGQGENVVRAVCQAHQLALIVNDVMLVQVRDDTFGNGDVGVIAGNFGETGVDIVFDDFIVVKP
ncbi:hypothetical protein KQH56_02840 [bacterium]|nr:hypothetical protein [bacterium]